MNHALQLLKYLSKKELTSFKENLTGSTRKKDGQLLALVTLWEEKKGLVLDERIVFSQLFPQKEFSAQGWYTLMTQLQSRLEVFLAMLELQEDKALQKVLLLKAFRRRKLPHFFHRIYKQYEKLMLQLSNKNPHQVALAYEGQEIYYDYIASQNRKKSTNLSALSKQLDVFFVSEKLKQICRAYSRRMIHKKEYHIGFKEEVLDTLSCDSSLLQNPTIRLYYAGWKAVVQEGSVDDFLSFKHLLETTQEGVSTQDMRDLLSLAAKYCIPKSNAGHKGFETIALSIYLQNLERGFLLKDGILPAITLMNIVSLGLKQGQFEWIETFLEQNIGFIPKPVQHSVMALTKARMYYLQEQWDDAQMQLLLVSTVGEKFLYIGAKSLEIKIHIQQYNFDDALRELDNLSKYLKNISKDYHSKVYYTQFVNYLRQLLRLNPGDTNKRLKLVEAIKSDVIIKNEREWLLKMILR